ncbi:MAG: carboxylate--amine ligase [Solirubrobacterales bacterium]
MARVQIGGAGGAPGNNVIGSLRASGRGDHIIGQSSSPADLFLADVDEAHLVPEATNADYPRVLLELLERTRPDVLLLQHDFEVRAVSRIREEILARGIRLALPAQNTIEVCVDKYRSYTAWAAAGLPVPTTVLLESPADLEDAIDRLGPEVWLRATEGGGGSGAIATSSPEFGRIWVDRFGGWGAFTAASMLGSDSITWQSIWWEGELVVAQTRRRYGWAFSNRAPAGVTGVTHIAATAAEPEIDELARASILAIDPTPHGVFGVDMTYDREGRPNLTEINIGRFFTTIHFFTRAGLNMPLILRDLTLDGSRPRLDKPLNPLPSGLVWIRGMDRPPVLTSLEELQALERQVLSWEAIPSPGP